MKIERLCNDNNNDILAASPLAAISNVVLLVVTIITASIAVACLCGPLGFFGGRDWQRRRPPHNEHGAPGTADLDQVARFIGVGGADAIREASIQLGVSEDAVREWWVTWQVAHLGPRRQWQ